MNVALFSVAAISASVCSALILEILKLEVHFWYAGTSSEHLGQGYWSM